MVHEILSCTRLGPWRGSSPASLLAGWRRCRLYTVPALDRYFVDGFALQSALRVTGLKTRFPDFETADQIG